MSEDEVQSGESPAAAVLRRMASVIDELADLDLDGESERELCEATVGLQAQANRLDGQRLRLLDRVDRREAYREDACVTAASWLRWKARLEHGAATRLAQAARRREQLPATTAALEAGDITLSHLLAATSAGSTAQRLDAIAACDETLAELACHASPREVKAAVARIRDAVDADGSDPQPSHVDEQGRDRRRELHLRRVGDLGKVDATLDPEVSELLASLLDALSTPDPPGTPAEQLRSAAERRADAFAEILRRASSTLGLPTVHGARPAATITVDLATVMGLDGFAAHQPRLRHFARGLPQGGPRDRPGGKLLPTVEGAGWASPRRRRPADPGPRGGADRDDDGAVAHHPCGPPVPHPAAVAAALHRGAAPPLPGAGL